jgi:hypothetical protein
MPIDRNSAQYITGAIYKPTQTSAPGVWDLDDQANNTAKNLWPLPPQAVQRSLRFNSADSTYLNRTFVAGTRTTWTWSGWIKRTKLGVENDIFGVRVDGDNQFRFYFNSSDKIDVYNQITASIAARLITTQVFRDPSAWFHIVLTIDTTNGTAGDRFRLYVNGSEITAFDTDTQPSSSYQTFINSANPHYLGYFSSSSLNAYLADVNFIDGQALTPSSFGETDPQTGVWIPKRYTGTYGTNGFKLSFANNSSTTALGYDSSGNGNNWTPNNFSVTPGVGNDVFVDVPSLYGTDTGLGGEVLGNYATFNPLVTQRLSLSDGNLKTNWVTSWGIALGSIAVNSGMWYFESYPDAGQWHMAGVDQPKSIHTSHVGGNSTTKGIAIVYDPSNTRGDISYNGGNSVYTGGSTTFNSGDVIGVALDLDNNNVKFYKNNILQYNLSNLLEAGAYYTFAVSMFNGGNIYGNFGQRPFKYTAPTGYKALCTTNLPAPAIGQTSSNQADNYFNVVTWTGNGSNRTITGVGFQPDLIWIKNRSQGAASTQYAHNLYDTVRGINAGGSPIVQTNLTDAEITYSGYGVSAVNADGFSLIGNGSLSNFTGDNYVAWCWNAGGVSVTNSAGTNGASVASTYRANKSAGFSIVTYSITSASANISTFGHGLSTAPNMVVLKVRNSVDDWTVYHSSIATPNSNWLTLNSTAIAGGSTSTFSQSSTTFGVRETRLVASGGSGNVVAYCWTAIPGYSAFGSWQNNNSTDGTFIYTGFKPAMILLKNTDNTENWYITDSKRPGYNVSAGSILGLSPNLAASEPAGFTSTATVDILSNGFKLRTTNPASGEISFGTRNYIYAAFAETPARLSTAR